MAGWKRYVLVRTRRSPKENKQTSDFAVIIATKRNDTTKSIS